MCSLSAAAPAFFPGGCTSAGGVEGQGRADSASWCRHASGGCSGDAYSSSFRGAGAAAIADPVSSTGQHLPVLKLASMLGDFDPEPPEPPCKWGSGSMAGSMAGSMDGTLLQLGGDDGALRTAIWSKAKYGKKVKQKDEPSSKAVRAAHQLRQLLDFYFEPFNFQHNRYLLDLMARSVGAPDQVGPWLTEQLAEFRFVFKDLEGLGRIAQAMAKMRLAQCEVVDGLKHLDWSDNSQLQLKSPPEVRSLVAAKDADPEAVAAAKRFLTAVKEHQGEAPAGLLSVLSYAVGITLADKSEKGVQRQAQLKRQLLLHCADVICLHGLDPEGAGESVSTTLVEEGYLYAVARSAAGEANSIFYDPTRLEMIGRAERGAGLAVDLAPLEDGHASVRIVCVKPPLPSSDDRGLWDLFGSLSGPQPLVVCADLSEVGGAGNAVIIEELSVMSSVSVAVLGEELQTPRFGFPPAITETAPGPTRGGASDFVRLHRPDGIFFNGLKPLLALSGHTEPYLMTMRSEDVAQQFPAFRVPILAAFDWRASEAAAPTASQEECPATMPAFEDVPLVPEQMQ